MSIAALPRVLLFPPANLLLLIGVGLWLRRRRLVAVGALGIWVLSLPVVAESLTWSLERGLAAANGAAPGAIVILGGNETPILVGGHVTGEVGALTLERERAGAALARRSGLPVLVTGGPLATGEPPIAAMMRDSLHDDFAVTPRWVEPAATDTWANGRLSAAMLARDGVSSVLLVTHAWHMRRAALAFRHFGLTVIPAPVRLDPPPRLRLEAFLPTQEAALSTYYALHEWVGLLWYRLRVAMG